MLIPDIVFTSGTSLNQFTETTLILYYLLEILKLEKVDFLTEASNRKHPTQPQLKILKEKLPELQVLPHIISSNIFRQQLINREFLEGIAQLAKDCFQANLFSEPNRIKCCTLIWKSL